MNHSMSLADNVSSVRRLRFLLALIAAANLLCGSIWLKISYDMFGVFSASFNIGLVLLLCGLAALRCLTMTRGLRKSSTDAKHRAPVEDQVSERSSDDVGAPAVAAAPQPPAPR